MKNQTSPNVALIPLDAKGVPLVTANMKGACIGELKIQRELTCPECDADDPDPDCEICHGERDYTESEPLDWNLMKEAYKMMAKAAIAENPQYSLDHDVLGIRALVVDTITGVLFLGNCEAERPPAGHWLESIYEMGAATAGHSNESEYLRGMNAGLVEENNRLRQERDALKAVNAQLLDSAYKMVSNDLCQTTGQLDQAIGRVMWEKKQPDRTNRCSYSILELSGNGMEALRQLFPDGEANDLNFVLFSTSGVHGYSASIENVESDPEQMFLTFVVVQPRIVCMRYGNCQPSMPDDFAFLKKLRASSIEVLAYRGAYL